MLPAHTLHTTYGYGPCSPPHFFHPQGNFMDTLSGTTLVATSPPSTPFVALADGGLAANFGSGTYLRTAAADDSLPTGASPRTVAAWVQPSSMSGDAPLISWGAAGTANASALVINAQLGVMGIASNCLAPFSASYPAAPFGFWTHVAFTYDGATAVAYRNGIVRACSPRAYSYPPLPD